MCRIGNVWSAPYLSSSSLIWTSSGCIIGLVDPSDELAAFSGMCSSGDQDFFSAVLCILSPGHLCFNALPYKWVCVFLTIRSLLFEDSWLMLLACKVHI